MAALLRAYSAALHRYPTVIQSLQAGSLAALGDVTSQFLIEGHTVQLYDWKRSARFFILGSCLVGPAQKTWYGFLQRLFGSAKKTDALKKVLVDQALFAPSFLAVCLAAYGALQGNSAQEIKTLITTNHTDIVLTGWMIWPAVQVCNFSFVPLHHQVLVVQTCALFWNTYLAWKINRDTLGVQQLDTENR